MTQGAHILAVDDDRHIRDLIRLILEDAGHRCTGAGSAKEAWARLREDDFELVLCDVRMPGQSGLELARHIIAEHPDTPVVMVTALDDAGIGQGALAFGAYGYVLKPFRQTDLLMNVENALRRRRQDIVARRERDALERSLEEQAAELKEAMLSMRESARAQRLSGEDTVRRLSRAIEFRSRETWQHIERMGELSALLAAPPGVRPRLRRHDPGRGSDARRGQGRRARRRAAQARPARPAGAGGHAAPHGDRPRRALRARTTEVIQLAASIALTHHERFDGGGIPGRDRPAARSRSRAGSPRWRTCSTRSPATGSTARRCRWSERWSMIEEGSGTQFDPQVAERLLESVDEVEQIRRDHSEPVAVV